MMKLSKYRVTVAGFEGCALIVYENGSFKSFLTDVKPPFNQTQLNWLLSRLPDQEMMLAETLIIQAGRKMTVELVTNSGKLPANQVIALFCDYYYIKNKIKYKATKAYGGKLNSLNENEHDWQRLLHGYFNSSNFLFKNKYSIANLVKYWNELRAEVFGKPVMKEFTLPYSHSLFVQLDTNDQRAYWKFLRENGYEFKKDHRGKGEWVLKEGFI